MSERGSGAPPTDPSPPRPKAEPEDVWALWAVPQLTDTMSPSAYSSNNRRGRWIENSVGLSIRELRDLRVVLYAMVADTPLDGREVLRVQRFGGWDKLPLGREPVDYADYAPLGWGHNIERAT